MAFHRDSMQALVLDYAGADFRVSHVARPRPDEGQVLVRIHASGINPLDTKIRAGVAAHAKHPLPNILGMDLAGVIEEVGPGVTQFAPGDEVYGMAGGVGGHQGSLAQYAAVDQRLVAPKPRSLSMREAAALPLVFITAWEGLVDRAHLDAGKRVLVQGGAGGVGHVAIQIAKSRGAEVYATASRAKLPIVERFGATGIDYVSMAVEAYVGAYTGGEGFDLVYDCVGGQVLDDSFKAVKRFGHVVSALGWGTHALAPLSFKSASYSGVFTLLPLLTGIGREHHGEILREATRLADQSQLTPLLDPRRFSFDQVGDAHAAIEANDVTGKLVVDID